MTKFADLDTCEQLFYYGNSDLLAQLVQELQCHPDSCFSKDVFSWYNELYSSSEEFSDCRFRVDPSVPDSLEDAIEILLALVAGQNRRIALVAIRIICRETQRRLTLDLSETP